MNNSKFPPEILKLIFDYSTKQDLNNCELTCKTWYKIAHFYFSDDISINLNDCHFAVLLQDLNRHPVLAAKIKSITLTFACTGSEDPVTFRTIANCCPNLTILRFKSTKIHDYLKALNSNETVLPNIEKILVGNLSTSPSSIKRLHLWINFRFRNTITHLKIFDLENIGALKNYDRLVNFVASFPNLKYLKAQLQPDSREIIDISSLLKSNNKLEAIKLYGVFQISVNEDYNGSSTSEAVTSNNTLTKLKLDVSQTSIKFLEFIMQNFEKLNNLRLIVHTELLPDDTLHGGEDQALLDNFNEYYNAFQTRINISYGYRNRNFTLNRGKQRQVVRNNNEILGGFPIDLDMNLLDALLLEVHLPVEDEWQFHQEGDIPDTATMWPSPPDNDYDDTWPVFLTPEDDDMVPTPSPPADEDDISEDMLHANPFQEEYDDAFPTAHSPSDEDYIPNDIFPTPSPPEGDIPDDMLTEVMAFEDMDDDNFPFSTEPTWYTPAGHDIIDENDFPDDIM